MTYRDVNTGEVLSINEHVHLERIFVAGRPETFIDAVSGQPLQTSLVRAARAIEMKYFDDKKVWEKRPHGEAFQRTDKSEQSSSIRCLLLLLIQRKLPRRYL